MSDSGTTQAERRPQQAFSLAELGSAFLLLVAIASFDRWLNGVPNREELGRSAATLRFIPVELDPQAFRPLRLAGAWEVRSDDPRVAGISALSVDRGDLLALGDSGVLVRFAPPTTAMGKAEVRELPGGPGSGRFKRNRDSEALARDPRELGWWVAFENRHELWLYDSGFDRVLERVKLGRDRWRSNKGIEALAHDGNALLAFPEAGQSVVAVNGPQPGETPIGKARGRIADATAISPGRLIAIERRLTPFGFANSLVWLERAKKGYRFARRIALPLRPIDNVEAIAAEQLPDGRLRLWLMTDDNFQRPLRTLLIALDLPGGGPGSEP